MILIKYSVKILYILHFYLSQTFIHNNQLDNRVTQDEEAEAKIVLANFNKNIEDIRIIGGGGRVHIWAQIVSECILIGGTVLTDIAVVVGTTTINQIKGMNFDKCFVGAAGITIQNGISSWNCEVAQMNKAAIEQSKEAFLVADSSKFGQDSRYKYTGIDDEKLKIITRNNCDLSLYGDKVIAVEVE